VCQYVIYNVCTGSTSCMNLTKGNEAAVDALQDTMSVEESHLLGLYHHITEDSHHPSMVKIPVYQKILLFYLFHFIIHL